MTDYGIPNHDAGPEGGDPEGRKRNAPFQGRQANDAIAGGAQLIFMLSI